MDRGQQFRRGDDVFIVNGPGEDTVENADEGYDEVRSSISLTLSDNIEQLTLTGGHIDGTGNASGNTIIGTADHNALSGLDGNDRLVGGAAADDMTGGTGADRFVFSDVTDFGGATQASADRITDFESGDKIVLAQIDAVAGGTDDPFAFIANSDFSGAAGELRFQFKSGDTLVLGI